MRAGVYRDRIRLTHPDTHDNSPESNARTAELNEAVEFFRNKLAG
jgi:curved DNA-binding protein CbpA